LSLFFKKRRISRTKEWDDSTIPRKRIQREKGRRIVNLLSAKQETRSWKTISFTLKSTRIFGILFAISWTKDLLKKILDAEEISRLKIPPTIPAHLEFIPTNVGDLELEKEKRARNRAQSLADKSYASKEASYLEGLKKLKQKIQQSNSSGSETCRCADQLRSPSISQVRSNQETGAGSKI
jgi:hypothetical protein